MAVAIKEKRIDLRVSSDAKKMIEEAAKLFDMSVSSYMLFVVLRQARLDLANKPIVLNNDERDALLNKLETPSKPNDELKKLLK